jgi:pyruvate kinase
MLSGETAVGNYPVEAVEMMARVARSAEEYLHSQPVRELDVAQDGVNDRHSVAVARAGVQAARELSPKLVAVWTATGRTVRLLARHRLAMPVVGIGHSPRTVRQMNLLYGVVPLHIPPNDHPAAMAQAIDSELLKRDLAHMDDPIIVLTSTAPQSPHATNTVLIHNVGSPR